MLALVVASVQSTHEGGLSSTCVQHGMVVVHTFLSVGYDLVVALFCYGIREESNHFVGRCYGNVPKTCKKENMNRGATMSTRFAAFAAR